MSVLIKQVEIVTQTMSTRTVRRLFNDNFRQQGQEHAEHILPLHFDFGAYQRYRYSRRTAKHTQLKFKKFGHRNPNVFRGDLRRVILATARGGVTATHRGWQVRARGTQKHRMWRNSRDELEQISKSEEERYGDTNMRRFVNRAGTANYRERSRRVIRR